MDGSCFAVMGKDVSLVSIENNCCWLLEKVEVGYLGYYVVVLGKKRFVWLILFWKISFMLGFEICFGQFFIGFDLFILRFINCQFILLSFLFFFIVFMF